MQDHLELVLAFLACLILSAIYILYAFIATPSGGHPFGHYIGIIGMMLMIITETVYTLRKRLSWLHWLGPLRRWLSFHIFTGIVGPFLVLLHSAFMLNGLAGFTLVMTGIVVMSGFVGRYIYTAVPRSRAGVELGLDELTARANALQKQLDVWAVQKPGVIDAVTAHLKVTPAQPNSWFSVLTRTLDESAYNQRLRTALYDIERIEHARFNDLEQLLRRRRQLEKQVASIDWVHRLLGIWRFVHIPLGVTLFTAAFIHVFVAVYFKGW